MSVTLLISATELASRIHDPKLVVVDCRFVLEDPQARECAYLEAHIPGAIYAHLDRDLSGPKTGRNGRHPLHGPEAMCEALGRLGLSNDCDVVAYDDVGGGLAAARRRLRPGPPRPSRTFSPRPEWP
jgi:thiosulfate/3-mercaptopyruvate sulfurtransferase